MTTLRYNSSSGAALLLLSADVSLSDRISGQTDSLGVRIEQVASCTEVLERLRGGGYQLLIFDADGVVGKPAQYLLEIRRTHPDLSIVVTATDVSQRLLLELIHIGVSDFVPKSVDPATLQAAIRSYCQPLVEDSSNTRVFNLTHTTSPPADYRQSESSGKILRATQDLQALNKTLKQHVSQLTILYQMGRDISENENWSDALDRFLMALVNYTGAEGAALLLFSDNESKLSVRSNFQVETPVLSQACQVLTDNWKHNPRGSEIHAIECYRDMVFNACLDRRKPWRFTIIPLKHRNRPLGFLLIDKQYPLGHVFKIDYHFLNTIQTILAEEVANASYISELRQLSRFNHKILDNIKSGVITTDLDGYVRFYNEQAAAMCTQLSGSTVVHFNQLFKSDAFGSGIYKRVIDSQKDTHVLNVSYIGKADSECPARLSITKMHDDNLNGTVLVAIFEDLTEQKQLERELRRNDRLRVLGQISAGVAHEIRNPLTGIATSVEVLGSKLQDDPEKIKYIRVILEEINRLNETIRSLLNFARPTKPRINSFALTELSQRVVNLLSDEAQKKGISLEVQDELKSKVCSADVNQLTQVLLNLVLNSIQACNRGDSVTMVLRNEQNVDAGEVGFARIDVIDSGIGVPSEIRDVLFEPFVTTKTHGTGLGLAISQQIVEEHHGQISCEFLKKGTRFSVRLPIGPRHT